MSGRVRDEWIAAADATFTLPDELVESDMLTQLGNSLGFRDQPRFEDREPPEFDISVTRGEHDVEVAYRAVYGSPPRKSAVVRHFRVGHLKAHAYVATATPSRSNPGHASIWAPLEPKDLKACKRWWSASERVTLTEIAAQSTLEGGGSDDETSTVATD